MGLWSPEGNKTIRRPKCAEEGLIVRNLPGEDTHFLYTIMTPEQNDSTQPEPQTKNPARARIVQTSKIFRTNNLHTINPTGHPEHARRGTNSPSPIRHRIKCVRPGSRLGYRKRNLPSPKTPTTEHNWLRQSYRNQRRKGLYTSYTNL